MKIEVKFVPQDAWVGGYWDSAKRKLYLCLLPMLPIVLTFAGGREPAPQLTAQQLADMLFRAVNRRVEQELSMVKIENITINGVVSAKPNRLPPSPDPAPFDP